MPVTTESSANESFQRAHGLTTERTLRVVLSTNSPGVSGNGSLDQNLIQIKGAACDVGIGNAGPGTLRVCVATDTPISLTAGDIGLNTDQVEAKLDTIIASVANLRLQSAPVLIPVLFDSSTSGPQLAVAGISSQTIRVHKLVLQAKGTVSVEINSDTTPISNIFDLEAGDILILDKDNDPWFTTAAAEDLNINLSANIQVVGMVYYKQS